MDGATNGEFRQKGRIVAGAYDYNLVKGADQHGWYLVSDKNGSETDPVNTDPVTAPGEGTGGDIIAPPAELHNMIVRPEAASYSANLAAANTLFATSMDDRPGVTQHGRERPAAHTACGCATAAVTTIRKTAAAS